MCLPEGTIATIPTARPAQPGQAKKNEHLGKITQLAKKRSAAEMAALRAELEEKEKEAAALNKVVLQGIAEMEVDEEERVARKKMTAIRRLSDGINVNLGNTSDSDGEIFDMEVEDGTETDNAEADESDAPIPKEKKAKGVSFSLIQAMTMLLTIHILQHKKKAARGETRAAVEAVKDKVRDGKTTKKSTKK